MSLFKSILADNISNSNKFKSQERKTQSLSFNISEHSVPGSTRHSSLHPQHLQDKISVSQSGLVRCWARALLSVTQYYPLQVLKLY